MSELRPINTLFVTAFYDLSEIETRPPGKSLADYLENGKYVLEKDVPMVIFSSLKLQSTLSAIRKRPENTIYIPLEFKDLPYYDYLSLTRRNWSINPIQNLDPVKDSLNYAVIQWSKITFLERVIKQCRDFMIDRGLTHICWIDMGIDHVHKMYKQQSNWPQILDLANNGFNSLATSPKSQVQLCSMKYVSTEEVKNRHAFYSKRGGHICGGLIRGGICEIMKFCKLFDYELWNANNSFLVAIDEMIFATLVAENRELFDLYYGDYYEIIINHPGTILNQSMVTNLNFRLAQVHGDLRHAGKTGLNILQHLNISNPQDAFRFMVELYAVARNSNDSNLQNIIFATLVNSAQHPSMGQIIDNNFDIVQDIASSLGYNIVRNKGKEETDVNVVA